MLYTISSLVVPLLCHAMMLSKKPKIRSFLSECATTTPYHVFKSPSIDDLEAGRCLYSFYSLQSNACNKNKFFLKEYVFVLSLTLEDWSVLASKNSRPENSFVDVFSMISSTLMFSLLSPNLFVHRRMNVRISVLSYKIYVESTNVRRFGL